MTKHARKGHSPFVRCAVADCARCGLPREYPQCGRPNAAAVADDDGASEFDSGTRATPFDHAGREVLCRSRSRYARRNVQRLGEWNARQRVFHAGQSRRHYAGHARSCERTRDPVDTHGEQRHWAFRDSFAAPNGADGERNAILSEDGQSLEDDHRSASARFPIIDAPFAIGTSIRAYERAGFVKIAGVFDAESLAYYRERISREVVRRNTNTAPEPVAYEQRCPSVRNAVARRSVLLTALERQDHHGLGSPAADAARDGTARLRGRHPAVTFGRDPEISDESERSLRLALESGWRFHHTGAGRSKQAWAVITIIYMADGIRRIEPQRKQHLLDWEAFMPGIRPGEVVDSPLNPVLN